MTNLSQVAPATTFSFDSHTVRVIADAGHPLFVAKDVAQALGYSRPNDAIQQHCKGAVKRRPLQTEGGVQEVRVIEEPDVYRLIFGSKLESAQKFQDWVFEEVLPTIRKTGEYRATINSEQQRAIQEAVNARARRDGTSHQSIYHDLKTRYHIPRYSELPASAFADCLQWLGSERQDRRIFAVRLMERGLRQYHERQDAIRTLSHRVAELGELAHILARELDHTRATLRDLERMGAIYDGLHEAQAHLGFPREILDAGREWN